MHSDYLGRAVAYNSELMRTEPDEDIQAFAPSPLSPQELAARALRRQERLEHRSLEAEGRLEDDELPEVGHPDLPGDEGARRVEAALRGVSAARRAALAAARDGARVAKNGGAELQREIQATGACRVCAEDWGAVGPVCPTCRRVDVITDAFPISSRSAST